MDSGTLSDPAVDAYVRENFVAVRIEKEHDPATFDSLNVTAWPTTIVMRPDRTEVARHGGALGAQELIDKLKAVETPAQRAP